MNTSASNTSVSGSLRITAGAATTTCQGVAAGDAADRLCLRSALEPYQKELEFVIAQVWMTSEERIETVDGAIVIDAHLEEKGVVWRVGDIRSGACLGCALRCYNGVEITLPARH